VAGRVRAASRAAFAAFGVDLDFGLGRGPVVVDVGIENAGIELVDGRGVGRVDVPPVDMFPHNGGVFGFHQAIVAALAGTAFGLLNEQLFQQLRHGLVDEFTAIVGVEVKDDKGELLEDAFQKRHQPSLRDARCVQHHFPLRHFVDSVDVIDSLAFRAVALMHGIDA